MCSGIFQRFLLHITCLWFATTLEKTKHVENAFTCYMLHTEMILLQWQCEFYEKKLIRNCDKEMKSAPLTKQGGSKGSSKKLCWSNSIFVSRPIEAVIQTFGVEKVFLKCS